MSILFSAPIAIVRNSTAHKLHSKITSKSNTAGKIERQLTAGRPPIIANIKDTNSYIHLMCALAIESQYKLHSLLIQSPLRAHCETRVIVTHS
jgi:hypothetical protein